MQGEADVALGREAILRFSDAIDPVTVTSASIYAESVGVPLPGNLRISEDRLRVTLFFTDPLPDQSSLQVFVEGDLLRGANGQPVDANGDRRPGGRWALGFSTQNLDVATDTRVCGRVLASQAAAGGHEVPLVDVTISVDGAAGQFS
ncbi:MAG: Ig-like domain-containing protein, partial [Acidobacteriota bacterium]